MAGEKGGGKETGGAQLKRVESLETELGVLYDRLEHQGNQIQNHADSIASIQSKMDQKFAEVLNAISKNRSTETKEKKVAEGEPNGTSVVSLVETPRDYSGGSRGDTGGSRNTYGGGDGSNGGNNWRYRKLDMPLFDGDNPDGWILRSERYFNFYKLSEGDKLEAAIVALEGDALLWFQWEHRRRPITRWDELKSLLLRQFRPIYAGTLYQQWLALVQTGTVHEYQRSFIELLAPLSNIAEDVILGQFVNGLQEDIRSEVQLFEPISIDHAMSIAIKVEGKLRPRSNCKSN